MNAVTDPDISGSAYKPFPNDVNIGSRNLVSVLELGNNDKNDERAVNEWLLEKQRHVIASVLAAVPNTTDD